MVKQALESIYKFFINFALLVIVVSFGVQSVENISDYIEKYQLEALHPDKVFIYYDVPPVKRQLAHEAGMEEWNIVEIEPDGSHILWHASDSEWFMPLERVDWYAVGSCNWAGPGRGRVFGFSQHTFAVNWPARARELKGPWPIANDLPQVPATCCVVHTIVGTLKYGITKTQQENVDCKRKVHFK